MNEKQKLYKGTAPLAVIGCTWRWVAQWGNASLLRDLSRVFFFNPSHDASAGIMVNVTHFDNCTHFDTMMITFDHDDGGGASAVTIQRGDLFNF